MNPAIWNTLPASACTPQAEGAEGPDRITKTMYASGRRVQQIQSGVGTVTQVNDATYTYNGTSLNPDGVVDAEGNRTNYSYDGYDRLSQINYPSPTKGAGTASETNFDRMTYDQGDRIKQKRLRNGHLVGLTYDLRGQLIKKDVPNVATHEYDVDYAYDNFGNLTQANDSSSHHVNAVYDALSRKVSEQSNWTTRQWQYDVAGQRTRLTWGDGFFVTYDYDSSGKMRSIQENGSTTLVTFWYDNLGRRITVARANGRGTNYLYDTISRLSQLRQNRVGGANDQIVTLGYNPAGQVIDRTGSNNSYAWTGYVNINRPYKSNGLNQLTASGGTNLGYDPFGNLRTSGADSYSFTSENRLVTAPGHILRYDPLGRLYGISNAPTPVSWMEYDGSDPIEERDSSGVLRRYVFGPGVNEPLIWYEGAGTTDRRFLHADERGSIVAVTNNAGNPLAINRYDEYGIPQTGNLGRFQYTGQVWLSEIGLYHYKARIYSPTLGRFMQTDPLGYGDGLNMYAYAGNDPVNFSDPFGLCSVTVEGPDGGSKQPLNCNLPGGGGFGGGFSDGSSLPYLDTKPSPSPIAPRVVQGPLRSLFERAQDLYCSVPAIGGSFSVRGYDILGGGLASDIAFDPQSGRLSFSAGIDVGVGVGGSANWSFGNSVTVGRNVPSGWSGSVGVNANTRLGPIAAGVSTTLIGRSGPGFGGVSAGVRPGGAGATVNANLGARGGYGGQILPSCGG